eukprot:gene1046-10565_t
MSVFFKFKSAKDYDTYHFDSNLISLSDLKEGIINQKKLGKALDFDLVIKNAQTNEIFRDEVLIPKNTSVIIERVPVTGRVKVQQQQQQQISSSSHTSKSMNTTMSSIMNSRKIFKTSTKDTKDEETRRNEMLSQVSQEWDTQGPIPQQYNFQHSRIPPSNYVCHRCEKPGHYIQHCPTNNDPTFNVKKIKKATGIPKSFLQTVENNDDNVDDGSLLMTPNGSGFAKILSNEGEFEKHLGNSSSNSKVQIEEIPIELKCSICKNLLKKAVTVSCCSTNYCDSCITKTLLDETHFHCPNCKKQIDLDNLTSNQKIRNQVEDYKKNLTKKKIEVKENKNDISTLNPSLIDKKNDDKNSSNESERKKYSSNKKFDNRSHRYQDEKESHKRKRSNSPCQDEKKSLFDTSSREYKYRRSSRSPERNHHYHSSRRYQYDDRDRSSSRERYHSRKRSDSKERDRKEYDSRDSRKRSNSKEKYSRDRSSSRERYHRRKIRFKRKR